MLLLGLEGSLELFLGGAINPCNRFAKLLGLPTLIPLVAGNYAGLAGYDAPVDVYYAFVVY